MEFEDNGCLPPIVHPMTWDEFYENFSFSPKRKELLGGLKKAITKLSECGCTAIYIDGSFVTNTLEPNDYDACWEGDIKSVHLKMKEIEPVFLEFGNKQKAQKTKYFGEFFCARDIADSKETCYLDFFQQIRYSKAKKGIVKINL